MPNLAAPEPSSSAQRIVSPADSTPTYFPPSSTTGAVAPSPEQGLYRRGFHGLDVVEIEASPHRLFSMPVVLVARHGDHQGTLEARLLPQPLDDLAAAHPRHPEVEEDHVGETGESSFDGG